MKEKVRTEVPHTKEQIEQKAKEIDSQNKVKEGFLLSQHF